MYAPCRFFGSLNIFCACLSLYQSNRRRLCFFFTSTAFFLCCLRRGSQTVSFLGRSVVVNNAYGIVAFFRNLVNTCRQDWKACWILVARVLVTLKRITHFHAEWLIVHVLYCFWRWWQLPEIRNVCIDNYYFIGPPSSILLSFSHFYIPRSL